MALTTRKYVTGDNNVEDCAVDVTAGVVTFARINPELEARVGATSATAATTDTGTFSLIQLFKRLLQRVTTLIGLLPAELDASGGLKVAIVAGASSGGGVSSAEFVTASPVAITTSDTDILTIDVKGYSRVGFIVQNVGATALNSFRIAVRYNSTFSFYFPEATDAAAFTSGSSDQTGNATALIRKANQSPVTLGAGQYAWIRLNVEGVESIKLDAKVASGSTTVSIWGVKE